MAKRKAKVAAKSFITLYSQCGTASQLEAFGDGTFKTIAEARKAMKEEIDCNGIDGNEEEAFVIAQIVDVGKISNDVNWTGKKEL